MVLLTTTPQILTLISTLPPSTPLPSNLTLPTSPSSPIDHKTLIQLSRLTHAPLNTLLRNTRPYVPPPPPPPQQTREYRALKAQLLAAQEQRAYDALLPTYKATTTPLFASNSEGEDDISPSLVLNILLSIVLCAFVAFHVTRYWQNDGLRVLVALGTAVVVGVAEVVVYAGYLRAKGEARERDGKLRERKVLIGEVGGSGEVVGDGGGVGRGQGEDERKEEIWGRGVNGGMRRRVREKWEKEQELYSS